MARDERFRAGITLEERPGGRVRRLAHTPPGAGSASLTAAQRAESQPSNGLPVDKVRLGKETTPVLVVVGITADGC